MLSESPEDYERRGVSGQVLAAGRRVIARRYGMPIHSDPRRRPTATVVACRAVAATRRHAPERADALLRQLRVLGLSEGLGTDAPETIARAAREAGVDPASLAGWTRDPQVEEDLRRDMTEARDPGPAALALPERLARTDDGGWRYTAPSYRIFDASGRTLEAPGFQPVRTYEMAIANLAPHLVAREAPRDVAEVLAWATHPLATAEVAEICEIDREAAWDRLSAVADLFPTAGGAFWSVRR